MNWMCELPKQEGEYWIAEQDWCDGEPMHVRVFRDNDGVLMCQAIGWLDPVRLEAMPFPSYWLPVDPPPLPVFA